MPTLSILVENLWPAAIAPACLLLMWMHDFSQWQRKHHGETE